MTYEEYNEDYGRNEFGTASENEISKYNALQSLLAGEELGEEEVKNLREFECVERFLETPMGDLSEANLKKAFAAAVVAANEQGELPFKIDAKSPVEIASAVDEGLARVKLAYKASQEELDVIEVADHLIDATTVRVATITDRVIERGVPVVLDKLSKAITKVFPRAVVFVPFIKKAEAFLVPAAKVAVRKGLSIVAQAAKTVVRSVATAAKKIGSKIKRALFG